MNYVDENKFDVGFYKWLALVWLLCAVIDLLMSNYGGAFRGFCFTFIVIGIHKKSLRIEALTNLVTEFQCAICDATINEKE